jgi:hypothetical protein
VPGFPRAIVDPVAEGLRWSNADWDPALRFWTLGFDPFLTEWLRDQDASLPSIQAAREFAAKHTLWRYAQGPLVAQKGWLDQTAHLDWQTSVAFVRREIDELFDLMEDDRDRYMGEINAQADGLPAYFIHFLGLDGERRPWTIELVRCGLAIGNLVYMNYKEEFRRVRPSRVAPGLAPPFGPPRHPSFPSGHSFLGHFIALLLLEVPEIARTYGEKNSPKNDAEKGHQPKPDEVMSLTHTFNGPLMWLAERLGRNRERAGLHYPSDSAASRWLAGAIWAMLTGRKTTNQTAGAGPVVAAADAVDCPSLQLVLRRAKSEWED